MTLLGWAQIALYCLIIVALTRPLGGYMTRLFAGEHTFLTPVLGPVERGFYRAAGVDEHSEQHWVTYGLAMLAFSAAGFFLLYALQRLQGVLPLNPQGMAGTSPHLAFNTAVYADSPIKIETAFEIDSFPKKRKIICVARLLSTFVTQRPH